MSRVFKNKGNVVTQIYKKNIHDGIDLVGTGYTLDYIVAHSAGKVVNVRSNYATNDKTGASYGNFVLIKHDNGYYTLYAHMQYNSVKVKVGQRVSKGQIIGYMGNTGHSFGAHLHFEVRNKSNVRIDPTKYINADLPKESKTPTAKYSKGTYKVIASKGLNVRTKPSTTEGVIKKYSQFTKNAQEQIYNLVRSKPNCLVAGVVCDVSEVKGNWGKIPSGWICLDYCKKI